MEGPSTSGLFFFFAFGSEVCEGRSLPLDSLSVRAYLLTPDDLGGQRCALWTLAWGVLLLFSWQSTAPCHESGDARI